MATSNFDVTSANAQLVLTVDQLFPSGIELQHFSADGVFSSDAIEMTETRRSVDGRMVAGVIKNISSVSIVLEAASPSVASLEYLRDCMEANNTPYECTLTCFIRRSASREPSSRACSKSAPDQRRPAHHAAHAVEASTSSACSKGAEMDEIKIQDGATEKRFTITKMSAYQAEQWLYRAAFALGRGVDDIQQVFSGDSQTLLRSILSVPYESAKPLLDDLLSCCTLVQGNALRRLTSAEACSAIESPLTLTKLRVESLKANFGFSSMETP